MLSIRLIVDVAAVLVATLMTGNEIAVAAFFHPVVERLKDGVHARAAQPLARRLGSVMPFWYAASAILSYVTAYLHHGRPGFIWISAAAALFTLSIVATVIWLVPINNRIARMDPAHPYVDWRADRARWDRLHRIRVLALGLGCLLLVAGVLARS